MNKNELLKFAVSTTKIKCLLLISLNVIAYEYNDESQKEEIREKIELSKTTGVLPDGLSIEFGTDLSLENQIEGEIQRVDKRNRAIIVKDDVYICNNKVNYSSNNQKTIRFRNLKKGMQIRMDFEIAQEGLLAKRIHLKNNAKKKKQKADRYNPGSNSY